MVININKNFFLLPAVSSAVKGAIPTVNSGLTTDPTVINSIATPENNSSSVQPKAYLHVLLFNEQFQFDSAHSVIQQIGTTSNIPATIIKSVPVKKNGYAYIYFSNESDNTVYFDNFKLTDVRGPELEENHYYPFGLTMTGISSEAMNFGGPANNNLYNKGSELQHKEFSDGSGLEEYDTHYRQLDPQTGRWNQIDPKIEDGQESTSPYSAMANDPILNNDPLGDEPDDGGCCGFWSKVSNALDHVVAATLGAMDAIGADNSLGALNMHSASEVGYSGSKGTIFEMGQDFGHAIVLVQASIEDVAAGSGEIASFGLATPVAAAVGAHSLVLGATALKNLINPVVNASGNNPGSSSNSSSKQRNAPQQNGTPNSSKIESKDANGKTTKYSTYDNNGKIKKQVQVDPGSTRHGVSGATKKVPNYNTNPSTGQKFINGYKVKKAMPAETPPGTN